MKCNVRARTGTTSRVASKMLGVGGFQESDARLLQPYLYSKEFEDWYGNGKRDAASDPYIRKQTILKPGEKKKIRLYFKNDEGEELSVDHFLQQAELEDPQTPEDIKVSNVLASLIRRREIYKNRDVNKATITKLNKVIEKLENARTDESLVSVIESLTRYNLYLHGKALKDTEDLKDDPKKLIRRLSNRIEGLQSTRFVNDLWHILRQRDSELVDTEAMQEWKEIFVDPVSANIAEIKNIYQERARKAVAAMLYQFNRDGQLSESDLQRMLVNVNGDISWTQMMADSMAESPDQILALAQTMIEDAKDRVRERAVERKQAKLQPIFKKLKESAKKRGVKQNNFEEFYGFMLNFTEKGELKGELKNPEQVAEKFGEGSAEHEFTKFYYEELEAALSKLPNWSRARVGFKDKKWAKNPHLIPIFKNNVERAYERGGKAVFDAMREGFTVRSDEVDMQQAETYLDENGKEVKFLPIYYMGAVSHPSERNKKKQVKDGDESKHLDTADISADLASSLLSFSAMADNFEQMSEIMPLLNAAKDLVSERTVNKMTTKRGAIMDGLLRQFGINKAAQSPGATSNALKQLEGMIDILVFNDRLQSAGTTDTPLGTIDNDKILQNLMAFTGRNALGLNFLSTVTNGVMGTVMNGIEASSKMFFNSKEYSSASKQYMTQIAGHVKDATGQFPTSKWGIIVETFDIMQSFNEFGQKIPHNRAIHRKNVSLEFLRNGSEHMLQTVHAAAFFKSHKVVKLSEDENAEKEILSYYEWLDRTESPNNKESRKEFDKLKSVEDSIEIENGVAKIDSVSRKEMNAFLRRVKGNYEQNHGNFGRNTVPLMTRSWVGRLVLMFRRWAKPGWNRRFRRSGFDQRLGMDTGGNYTITKNFLTNLVKEVQDMGVSYAAQAANETWSDLPHWQRAQVRKTFTEIAFITGTMIAVMILSGIDDELPEEERTYMLKMGEYLSRRAQVEMMAYVSPNEAMAMIRSPSAIMSTVENFQKAVSVTLNMDAYQTGDREGELKMWNYWWKLVPYGHGIEKFVDIEEPLEYQRGI